MASSAGSFFLSRVTDLSVKQPLRSVLPFSHRLVIRQLPPAIAVATTSERRPPTLVSCLVSGVDGGGVSDDFVSTTKSSFDRGFSVIANMLKRIQPLDSSVISKGVSDAAKDSMKQTISTMLGLLPSDQFSVIVRVSKRPLDRLLVSSIITGYTLWNAEYRISLMRNFDISPESWERLNSSEKNESVGVKHEESEGDEVGAPDCIEYVQRTNLQNLGDLSLETLSHIERLESELISAKQELHAQKQEYMQMEQIRESNNDILKYLQSLESDMVTELSRPSSLEVEEIIRQLAQNILRRFFKDETASDYEGDSAIEGIENHQNSDDEICDTIGTSRDYLAKLLFWCMLLGHHLRGLENRLHLSCVVGLL